LVIDERESDSLKDYLRAQPVRASCALALVEVGRATKLHSEAAVRRAREVLLDTNLINIDDDLLASAAGLASASLCSLDAIHIAAALGVRQRLHSSRTISA
jgi:hypothetical protein